MKGKVFELLSSSGCVSAITSRSQISAYDLLTTRIRAAKIGQILYCEFFLTGAISNFGVKTEGRDFQIAQKELHSIIVEVDVKVIKVETAEIVYNAYGKAIAEKTVKNVFGMGGSPGYDETLATQSLRAALSEAVKNIIAYFKHHS